MAKTPDKGYQIRQLTVAEHSYLTDLVRLSSLKAQRLLRDIPSSAPALVMIESVFSALRNATEIELPLVKRTRASKNKEAEKAVLVPVKKVRATRTKKDKKNTEWIPIDKTKSTETEPEKAASKDTIKSKPKATTKKPKKQVKKRVKK